MPRAPEPPDATSSCRDRGWPCYDRCDDRSFSLARQSDIRGLLHCHTHYDGGAHCLPRLVETARELELEYLGVTDRLLSEFSDGGLTPLDFARQSEEIEALNGTLDDFTLLHGVEVEVGPDGELPDVPEVFETADFVVATLLRDNGDGDRRRATNRAVRAIMNSGVSILGHPLGDYMTTGRFLPLDLDTVLVAAAEAGVAVELDANPRHEDLVWHHCEEAQQRGIVFVISSDVHRAARLIDYRHGAELSRKAGICRNQILNTCSLAKVREFLSRD